LFARCEDEKDGGVHMFPAEKKSVRAFPRPILKWAGGKQQIIDLLLARTPSKYGKYIEPFFGGGALFFALQTDKAVIADSNPELINLYNMVASDVDAVISHLREMPNDKEFFYEIRSAKVEEMSVALRAARTIYLNRTCFNGLYRVNRQGQFNVPFGHYKKPLICDEDNLRAASSKLAQAQILLGDYKTVLRETAEPGDFIFLDPPYLPVSKYADFKRYTKEQFYEEDHRELAEEINRLHELGCHVVLTNSNHPLVHELFDKYKVEIFNTRRYINCDATKRSGEDVIVTIEPKKRLFVLETPVILPTQMKKLPATRYMGSKQNLLGDIWNVASQFNFKSVLDLFSGSGVVGYMMKAQGKQVLSNDYMAFSACFARATIQNNNVTLSKADIEKLLQDAKTDDFVASTFQGLYFSDEDNCFIDRVRANIKNLQGVAKRDVAMAALIRACLKKRPRGIFTYTGFRYDDGRKDLRMTLQDQFLTAIRQINGAVFDNGKTNRAIHGDAMNLRQTADLVYIDPPYYSPLSDNEYVRRYHFLEGIARDWKGVEIQQHTKTKKFKSYPTPFSTATAAYDAFDCLFRQHKDSVLIVSYSSNSLPTQTQMIELMAKYKNQVEVVAVDHRYSFGNQGHKVNDNRNKVQEYLFVGY
jgi:DNA adenine methylase